MSHSAIGVRLEVARAEGGETAPATVVCFPFYDPDKTRPRSWQMAFWPASVPPGKRRPVREVAVPSLRRAVLGAGRLVWWWPGLIVVALSYVAVAFGLFADSDPNLWGGVAAIVVGTAWYASPLRRVEARRRERLRGPRPPSGERRRPS